MNKYVKKLIETYANTFAFNPAVLSKGPTKKVSQQVTSSAYFPYQPKTDEELKKILRDHINNRNFDFNDITLYFMPNHTTLFNNKLLKDVDLEELREYAFEYRPKTNRELKDLVDRVYNSHLNRNNMQLSDIDVTHVEDFSEVFKDRGVSNNIAGWNVSNGKNFSKMFYNGWTKKDEHPLDLSKWDVSSGVRFDYMFYQFKDLSSSYANLKSPITGIGEWNVKNAKTFNHMFALVGGFNEDLSKWNVSNCEDFSYMFKNCRVFNGDLSRWSVGKSKSFSNMFLWCSKFNSDLSRWDVSNSKSFTYMFCQCVEFNADLSRWNVSNGVDFHSMFWCCKSFSCDLSKWDVSSGEIFESMFGYCERLKLDANKWDMSNAVNVHGFNQDSPGVILDIDKFVNEKGYIYKPATKEDLIEIINMYISDEYYDLNEINVSLITDFSGLFYNLSSIESKIDAYEEKHGTRETYHSDFQLDISKWDVCNGEDFSYMFAETDFINFDDIKNWNVSNGKNFSHMFETIYDTYNTGLKIDLSKWDVSNCEDFSYMFHQYHALYDFDFSTWDVGNGRNFAHMFDHGRLSDNFNPTNWDMSNAEDLSYMFESCMFKKVDLSSWDVRNVKNFNGMFAGCTRYTGNLDKWFISPEATMQGIFDYYSNNVCPLIKNPPSWYRESEQTN